MSFNLLWLYCADKYSIRIHVSFAFVLLLHLYNQPTFMLAASFSVTVKCHWEPASKYRRDENLIWLKIGSPSAFLRSPGCDCCQCFSVYKYFDELSSSMHMREPIGDSPIVYEAVFMFDQVPAAPMYAVWTTTFQDEVNNTVNSDNISSYFPSTENHVVGNGVLNYTIILWYCCIS